jgi:hypothetical protein
MNTHSSLSYGSGIAEKIAPLILRLALGLTLLSAGGSVCYLGAARRNHRGLGRLDSLRCLHGQSE